ncbi:MAG: phosphomannomutase/phosphoglucomutase, partial [candidate division KSB1 bacterium]|nr:phosphomannomutase/phosphoglucomutase [candidate division KSB1 bacterium]
MISGNIFREYDIRGIADTDLTNENVALIGKAFATHMLAQGRKRLVVGRDVRLTSERLRNALVEAMRGCGAEVIDVGVVPTPTQYFAIVHLQADGGVMITGSHNPIEYNGFKMSTGLKSADGQASVGAVYGEEIQQLYRIIQSGKFAAGRGSVETINVIRDYIATIKARVKLSKPLKIVVDPGNGCGGLFAPQIWKDLGCEVICLYCEPDGRFPNHLPDPTVMKYIKDLRERVLKEKADLGIGYDGDADRLGIVDNLGRPVFADKLLAMFARDTLTRHPGGKIVFDVKCSQALPEFIQQYGGVPIMWKTGHSLLKAKMQEEHAPLAGEMSGHIFFADGYFGFDDAIFGSGRMMQILSHADKTMAELHDEIPAFISTPEIRVEATDEAKFQIVADLVTHFKKSYQVIDIDGARVLFGDGWGLVRA